MDADDDYDLNDYNGFDDDYDSDDDNDLKSFTPGYETPGDGDEIFHSALEAPY